MTYAYKYPRPMVTVDVVFFVLGVSETEVLVIRRGNEPFKDRLALPGGFVEMEEDLLDAALRELEEETGLRDIEIVQLGAFGKPGRDPRGRNISVAFVGQTHGEKPSLRAGDDAQEALFVPVTRSLELAFDHRQILDLALKRLGIH